MKNIIKYSTSFLGFLIVLIFAKYYLVEKLNVKLFVYLLITVPIAYIVLVGLQLFVEKYYKR